jgi:hypothetical protein
MWPILLCLLLFLAKPAGGSEVPSECFELFRQARQQNIYFIPFIYHNKIVLSLTPGEKLSTIDLLTFSKSGVSLLNSTAFSVSASPLSTLDYTILSIKLLFY